MKGNFHALVSASAALLLSGVFTEAIAQNRGRLNDGSAYRTTRDGIQLVDHVAELEVTVEELKRQLEAARNEIQHKDMRLEELRQLNSIESVALKCPPQPQLACPDPEVTRDMLDKVQSESRDLQSELDKSRRASDSQKDALARTQTKKDEIIKARDQELAVLRAKLKVSDEQIAFLKSLGGVSRNESVRASVSLPASAFRNTHSTESSQSAEERAVREQTIESSRKTFRSDMAQVRELIRERDNLFAQYAQSGKSLQIKPSGASSSQNRNLDQLQRDVESETSLRMVTLMGRELNEIRQKISDDIELVRRVGKL